MWMPRPDVVGAIAAAWLLAVAPQRAIAPGIEALVERVEDRYEDASLQARVVQRRLSRLGSAMVSREGRLFISTPGRMRWEYGDTGELLVAPGTGRDTYFFMPADKQVHVIQSSASTPSQYPLLYLSGRGNLSRDFRIEVVEWGTPLARNNVQLELTPRRGETSFDRLILEVDPVRATIERLLSFDNLGATMDYQFHDVEYDAVLSDDLFEFVIPDGVDVVVIGG